MCRICAECDVSLCAHYAWHLVELVSDDLGHLIMVGNSDHDDQIDRARHGVHLANAVERGNLLRNLGDACYLGFHEDDRSDHGGHFNLQLLAHRAWDRRRRRLSRRRERLYSLLPRAGGGRFPMLSARVLVPVTRRLPHQARNTPAHHGPWTMM